MAKKSLLCPALEDPKVAAKVNDLLTQRNHADYICFLVLRDLLQDDTDENVQEAKEAITLREKINDQFTRAISGN